MSAYKCSAIPFLSARSISHIKTLKQTNVSEANNIQNKRHCAVSCGGNFDPKSHSAKWGQSGSIVGAAACRPHKFHFNWNNSDVWRWRARGRASITSRLCATRVSSRRRLQLQYPEVHFHVGSQIYFVLCNGGGGWSRPDDYSLHPASATYIILILDARIIILKYYPTHL